MPEPIRNGDFIGYEDCDECGGDGYTWEESHTDAWKQQCEYCRERFSRENEE